MYKKGEVVWAKIKGFPWWPGVVNSSVEQDELIISLGRKID
jgi:hypothetical protein